MAPLQDERVIVSRLVFIYIFLFLAWRFFLNTTPSHLLQPQLFILNIDFTYWLYRFSGIAGIITSKTGAVLFDIFIFTFCILSILFPRRRLFIIPFSILFLLYAVTYNTFIVHHAHPLAIMTFITLPFWCRKNESWKMLWEGMRYYICLVYFMLFIWKILPGNAFWYTDQGIGTVKYNLAEYIYHNPSAMMTSVYKFFISHPFTLNIGNIFIILLEGVMVTGLFTKRYDRYLLWIPVVIHVSTYFFSDVFFIEWLVLVFVFFTPAQINAVAKKIPLIVK